MDNVQKVEGKWQDKKVSISNGWGGHTFTGEEIGKLFNDEIITFEATSKAGKKYTVSGKLEEQEYEGKSFIGFKPNFDDKNDTTERFTGVWKDHPVSIKKEWGGHTFTESEIQDLLADKTIEFEAISKSNKPYMAKGKLAKQEYNGNSFIGFKLIFEEKKDDTERYEGTWKGRTVKFKRTWGGHRFTDEECIKLINGESIEFNAVSKNGKEYTAKGTLDEQQYEGNTFIGFKPNFN